MSSEFITKILSTPIYQEPLSRKILFEEASALLEAIRTGQESSDESLTLTLALLGRLQKLCPEHSIQVTELAIDLATGKCEEGRILFSCGELTESNPDEFVETLLDRTAGVGKGTLCFSPYPSDETSRLIAEGTLQPEMEIFGRISFLLKREDRKSGKTENTVSSMRNFAGSFEKTRLSHAAEVKADKVSPSVMKELCRIITEARTAFSSPLTRYRILCAVRILCDRMDWRTEERYMRFLCDYLDNLMIFSREKLKDIYALKPIPEIEGLPQVSIRRHVISIMGSIRKPEDRSTLEHYVENADPFLSRLARMALSASLLKDSASAELQLELHKEIVRCLSRQENNLTLGTDAETAFCGMESDTVEFKTSIIFTPKNSAEKDQSYTIAKTVCAFLNSRTGGTLYLGVNDSGYAIGLKDELTGLARMTLGRYCGIDGYVRYVTTRLNKFFNLGPMMHISVKPEMENQVVTINVSPSKNGIVKISPRGWTRFKDPGVAYIRLNSQTVLMQEKDCQRLCEERSSTYGRDYLQKQLLKQAIEKRKQVILSGYTSAKGTKDYHVEPYAFNPSGDLSVCYDIETKTCKIFKISRISKIIILEEQWKHQGQHQELKTDIFRMSGFDDIRIVMELDTKARNLLLEEYPDSWMAVKETPSPDSWLLDIYVCSVVGVARFFLGLADHIHIIVGPDLEEYVREYKEKYLNMPPPYQP